MSHPASIAASRSSAVGFVSCSWHMRQTATNRWPCLSACSPGTIAPPALRGRASCTSMLRVVQLSHEISHTGLSARNSATKFRRCRCRAARFGETLRIGEEERFTEALRRSGARRFSGISVPSKLAPHSGAFTCKYRTLLRYLEVTPELSPLGVRITILIRIKTKRRVPKPSHNPAYRVL